MITETSQTYANDKSFKVYIDYLALKKHFTTDTYDYHKYNGKVRASFDKFRTRKDIFFYYKLSTNSDYRGVLISNIIKNPNIWIRDILDDSGQKIYHEWLKRKESLSYIFKLELNHLHENWPSNFQVKDGQHPHLITLYLQGKISLETLTILARSANIFAYWQHEIADRFVAGDVIRTCQKYERFLEYQPEKFSKIIKDRFF